MRTLLFSILGLVITFAVTRCITGCQPVKPPPPPVNPVTHPFQSASDIMKKAQVPMLWVAGLAGVIALGSVGLMFTSFSMVSKVSLPVSATVCLGSYAGVLALPIFPWVLGGAGMLAAVAIGGYELYLKFKKPKSPPPPQQVQLVHA